MPRIPKPLLASKKRAYRPIFTLYACLLPCLPVLKKAAANPMGFWFESFRGYCCFFIDSSFNTFVLLRTLVLVRVFGVFHGRKHPHIMEGFTPSMSSIMEGFTPYHGRKHPHIMEGFTPSMSSIMEENTPHNQ